MLSVMSIIDQLAKIDASVAVSNWERVISARGFMPPEEFYNAKLAERGVIMTVLEFNGEVIGVARLYPVPAVPGCVNMASVVIDEQYRGMGFGKEMIDKIMDHLWSLNYTEVILDHKVLNAGSTKFWASQGFVPMVSVCYKKLER